MKLIFLFCTFFAWADLEIKLSDKNIESTKGDVYINIFKSKKGFPSNPNEAIWSKKVEMDDGVVKIDTELPDKVAVASFVDLNSNKKLDQNSIGVPLEPIAFSRNPILVFDKPDYQETVVKSDSSIELKFKEF